MGNGSLFVCNNVNSLLHLEYVTTIYKERMMICSKCTNESKINSHNEEWCTGCAMLIRACKCDIKNQNIDYTSYIENNQ
jgi:hypothetical protein